MFITGMKVDKETLEAAKRTGVFYVQSPEAGTNMSWITKNLATLPITEHLERLKKNIYDFSMSVDFTSESFYSQLSGIALAYKILDLETKCAILEQKTRKALRHQFEVLNTAWSIKNMNVDDIEFTFTRNLPVNLTEEVDNTVKLKGLVSEKTRLSQLSFIDDADKELEAMEVEQMESVSFDDVEMEEEDKEGNMG
jgi:SPP1 family phage portal protein